MVDKDNIVESEFRLNNEQFKSAMKETLQEMREAEKETKKINKEITDDSTSNAKKAGNLFDTIFQGWQKFSFNTFLFTMMIKQVTGFISSLTQLAKKSDEAKLAMIGLNSVAQAFGEDGGVAQKAAKELVSLSGGMVNLKQAGEGLKFLISSGYSVQEAFKLSKSMLEIGAFNNVVGDLGQAYIDATKGIKTGSVELTENIGLTQRLSSVMKQANVSIENGIDITNNANQRQALYNSVLKQSEGFVGNLKKVQDEYTGSVAKSQLQITNFMVNLGKLVQPIIKVGALVIEHLVKPFNEVFNIEKNVNSDKLFELTEEMKRLKNITTPTKEEQQKLVDVMNQISVLAPQAVTAYDNMGNAQINFAEATKVVIDMKKLELIQTNKQLEADIKINEQRLKSIELQKKRFDSTAMGMAGIETTAAQFAKFQSDVAISNNKNINDLTIEEMAKYAKVNKSKMVNAEGDLIDLSTSLDKALAIKNENTRKLNEDKKNLELELGISKEVMALNKKMIDMDSDEAYKALVKLRDSKKLPTKSSQQTDEKKYDALGSSKDFFQGATEEYQKNLGDYVASKNALDLKYAKDQQNESYKKDLAILESERKANELIFSEAEKTRKKLLDSKSGQMTQDIKGEFNLNKIKIENVQKNSEELLKVEKELYEKEQKELEKQEKQKQEYNDRASKNQVKLNGDILTAELEYLQEAGKDKTNLEIKLAQEKFALKRILAEEEIKLNQEILDAKTADEKENLQKSMEERLNAFRETTTKESIERQNKLLDDIEKEKVAKEEMEKARKDIEDYEIGNVELKKETFDKYKNITDEQRALLEKELADKQEYAARNIDWKNVVVNTEKGFTDTKNELVRKLFEGEKIGWTEMREMLKENLRESLLIEGQKLVGASISETVQGFIALASPIPTIKATAKDHFTAAGYAAAGALALGAISRTILPSSSSGSSNDSSSSSSSSSSSTSTTTKAEEPKEIHVHNTGLRDIAISLIPEFEELASKGYTKIVIEGN